MPVSLYDQGTIEAALYRMASKSSASLRVEGNSWLITFAPLEGTIGDIVGLFQTGIPVEIRIVLHSQTCNTLVRTSDFIGRNPTMVNHVAFMGLEKMGFGATNWEYLHVNPREYASALAESVCRVHHARIPVSIYNIPLCMLPLNMHRFATRSISDWKNDYPEECKPCVLKPRCSGFFSSTVNFYSKLVQPKFALDQACWEQTEHRRDKVEIG